MTLEEYHNRKISSDQIALDLKEVSEFITNKWVPLKNKIINKEITSDEVREAIPERYY
jgi:hypothetical protein